MKRVPRSSSKARSVGGSGFFDFEVRVRRVTAEHDKFATRYHVTWSTLVQHRHIKTSFSHADVIFYKDLSK